MIIKTGSNRHKVLQPVLKNIQLQYISAQDLMKVNVFDKQSHNNLLLNVGLQVVVPCGLFSSEKVMEALAYQADPGALDS